MSCLEKSGILQDPFDDTWKKTENVDLFVYYPHNFLWINDIASYICLGIEIFFYWLEGYHYQIYVSICPWGERMGLKLDIKGVLTFTL